jgi:ring-1,2-phenylacetyl-CoA epoxidase subunit PaaC
VKPDEALMAYTLRLADNALILSQRMVEVVAAEPELEEELANANFALDFIGQARMLYTHAGELEGKGRSEDDLAFMRDEHEYRNLLLLEQPNGHFGDALVRQFLFEAFYLHLLDALTRCSDQGLSAIAARAVKEVRYHFRHSSNWMHRLGDGTELSHDRIQRSLDDAWRYTGEMFMADEIDDAIQNEFDGPDLTDIQTLWRRDVEKTLVEATLDIPADEWMASGGKQGRHSEHLGFLLAEMQYLQRSFPGVSW